jgi:hypothetical protein
MKEKMGINSGGLFSNYSDETNRRRFLTEQALFWMGVLATVVTPEVFWALSQGRSGFAIFGMTAVAGIGFGLARYYRPFRINSCVSNVTPRPPLAPQTPLRWGPETGSAQRRGSQKNRRPKLATF